MSDKTCMYMTQGELRCCPTNDPSCFYDFGSPVSKTITKKQMFEKPIVIDEQKRGIVEKFTKNAPNAEYFQNDPAGLMSGYISTCQSVQE